jgi:hypothetical protein
MTANNDSRIEDGIRLYLPTPREAAITILRVLKAREGESGRQINRARISQTTVRKACGRAQVSIDFLEDVREVLLAAGWCFFCASASHYAIVKVTAVEGWPRISRKRIEGDLQRVSRRQFNFDEHEHLLLGEPQVSEEGED